MQALGYMGITLCGETQELEYLQSHLDDSVSGGLQKMLWGTVEYHDKSQFCLMRISLRATNTLYLKSVCHEPLYETKWKEEDESYNEASKIIKTRLVHSFKRYRWSSVQFSSVAIVSDSLWPHGLQHSRTPGFPVQHQLPELAQTHIHWVSDAIQPSPPLLSPSPPAFNLFQHQGLFQWVSSSHRVTKVLEFQLQHQSFQWIFRTDFL